MKTYKIFNADNKKSADLAQELRELLPFAETTGNADYTFAIGGDGTFLQTVKACNFSDSTKFIGINTGTLGFLQVIKPDQIKALVKSIVDNKYGTQELSYINCNVDGNLINCLNEIVIRNETLQIVNLKIAIDGESIETYAGDGVLIATSTGSTAYNLSLGGSIIHDQFHTLQLNPMAPLTTTAHSLVNSLVMPETSRIDIIPRTDNLLISADGVTSVYKNVREIQITLSKKRITMLKMPEHSFWQKINEKILRRTMNK